MLSIDTIYTVLSQKFSGLKVDLHPTSMGHLSGPAPLELGAGSTGVSPCELWPFRLKGLQVLGTQGFL